MANDVAPSSITNANGTGFSVRGGWLVAGFGSIFGEDGYSKAIG